jgi:predicted ATPase/class 3 adenylate cyclase
VYLIRSGGHVVAELPTGTVTFLFTDLERSTQLWEEQPGAMQAALARHDELLVQAVEAHGGRVVKGTGDGLHAVFSTASEAVAAAVAAQRALALERWGSIGGLRARMGLHTGAAEQRGDDYFGPVLNRAARLMSAGHGGQILVSRATEGLVRDALPEGCELVNLGEYRLRDVPQSMGVAQVVHPDLPRVFPPLRSLDVPTRNLPVQLTTFVGREAELRSLEKVLVEARLVTLTGSGGCGKTRLGLELARRVLESSDRGGWFVDLAPVSDRKAVPSTIASALGLRDDGRRVIDQLVDYLRDRDALLVVDNCEHLIAAAADAVEALLTRCPAVTVIATSREPLGVAGETTWRVPSLSVPERGHLNPEEVTEYEAVQLFVERARQANPAFTLTHQAAADIAEVCQHLDGIPLAIELAAARLRMMSPSQIRDGLADRFQLLTGGARTAIQRHQTLRASIDWSVDLLSPEERHLLARLSVFAGGFTLDAAQDVAAGSGIRATRILDLLTQLVDRSLVQPDEDLSVVRYHLLETIREYAAEQLVKAGEVDSIRDQHAAFFRSHAEAAEPHLEGHQQDAWADVLEQEWANLRGAIHWAATRGDGETAQRLVAALAWFFVIRAHLREAKGLFDIALDTQGATRATHARALQARAYIGWLRNEREAMATAKAAADLARQVNDRRTEARALYVSGFLTAENTYEFSDLEASIATSRELGDLWCLAHALGGAGTVHVTRGNTQRSQPLLRESVAVCEAMGDTYIANTSRFWLGRSLLMSGSLEHSASDRAAGQAILESVVIRARELGDTFSLPMALSYLGIDCGLRGDEELGFAYLDEALALARRLGRARNLTPALWMKAIVLLAKHDRTVRPLLEELMMLGTNRGQTDPRPCAGLALLDMLDGDLPSAKARLSAAQSALPADSSPQEGFLPADRSFVNMVAALVARAEEDLNAAEDFANEALALDAYVPEPAVSWRIEILETLAGILIESGEARDGTQLLAAAQAGRTRHLRPRPPSHDKDVQRILAVARQALGDTETDAAWAEGFAMPINDAAAVALARRRPKPSADDTVTNPD